MKKNVYYFGMAALLGLTMATSCAGDDDGAAPSGSNPQPVINAAMQGSWRVAYFFDDSDRTAQFTNCVFTFEEGNQLKATYGASTYTGSWSVTTSDSDDDHPHDDLDFNIGFSSPAAFAELSDDWDIHSYSATKIELVDVSGGNGGTDYLTFEKIP